MTRDATSSPYARDVVCDEPLGHWRFNCDRTGLPGGLGETAPQMIAEARPWKLENADHSAVVTLAVELWVKAPKGTLVRKDLPWGGSDLVLRYDGCLTIELTQDRFDTDVTLDDDWHHLAVVWDGEQDRLLVLVDGRIRHGRGGPIDSCTQKGGYIVVAPGSFAGEIAELCWYERAVHPSRVLSHYLVARVERPPTPLWTEAPLEIRRRAGHRTALRDVAFSPDDERCASLDTGGYVRLWDRRTGLPLGEFTAPRATRLTFDPTGRILMACGRDMSSARDVYTGERLWRVETGSHFDVFSPDGRYVARSEGGGRLAIVDASTGALRRILDPVERGLMGYPEPRQIRTSRIVFDLEGRRLAQAVGGIHRDQSVVLWELATGAILHVLRGADIWQWSIVFTPGGEALAAGAGPFGPRLHDLADGSLRWRVCWPDEDPHDLRLSPDAGVLAVTRSFHAEEAADRFDTDTAELLLLNTREGSVRHSYPDEVFSGMRWCFDPPGRFLLIDDVDRQDFEFGGVRSWDVDSGELSDGRRAPSDLVSCYALSPDGTFLACGGQEGGVTLWHHNGARALEVASSKRAIQSATISGDGLSLVTAGEDGRERLWDVTKARLSPAGSRQPTAVAAVTGEDVLMRAFEARGDDEGVIELRRVGDPEGATVQTLRGHTGRIVSLSFATERFLASASEDDTARIWDLDTGSSFAFAADGDEWLVYTEDGYFDGSPGVGALVGGVRGTRVFRADQLAIRYNRPDLIVERFHPGARQEIADLRAARAFRLQKAGIDESSMPSLEGLPDARILKIFERDDPPGTIWLDVVVRAAAVPVMRYQVYVNDVPIGGRGGALLSGDAAVMMADPLEPGEGIKGHLRFGIEVQLTPRVSGEDEDNRVELSVVDALGRESLRDVAFVPAPLLSRRDPVRLYFVSFGVSSYRGEGVPPLLWAHQDAIDLHELFRDGHRAFSEVMAQRYVNSRATTASFEAAKALLQNSRVQDTVLVFISGHGVHDEDGTYYYLLRDSELDRLQETAAHFSLVESLLEGIPARRKLMLMDTCESGELFTSDDVVASSPGAGRKGLRARVVPGGVMARMATALPEEEDEENTSSPARARHWLTQKNRFIHQDVFRRTGAVIFSSCLGHEASWEVDARKNGAFTDALLEELRSEGTGADLRDFDELRIGVEARVAEITSGLQHPTVDRDNLTQALQVPYFKGRRRGR